MILANGQVTYYNAHYADDVRPVVYLKSNIRIIHDEEHDGSEEKPYGLEI